jgi:hypothetical protein
MVQNREIYVVLGKALRVLEHAELVEPVYNLLHRRPPTDLSSPELPDR